MIEDKPEFMLTPSVSEQMQTVALNNQIKLNRHIKTLETLNGFPLNFWDPNALVPMDAGFLSVYYVYWRKGESHKDYRQQLKFPSDKLLILDSGGFQIFSDKSSNNPFHADLIKALTPEKVLEIQEAIADVGFILDIPPYPFRKEEDGTVTRMIYDPKFFNEAMQTTARNTEIALRLRSKSRPGFTDPLQIYGILQGAEYGHMIDWFDCMKGFAVDGWALGPKPRSDYTKTFMFIWLVLDKQINVPIHFLGVSGFNALALIIYLLRKDKNGISYFQHRITADSTSYDSGARRRSYTLPGNFRKNIFIGREKDKEWRGDLLAKPLVDLKKNSRPIRLKFLPCPCPICQNSSVEQMQSETDEGGIAVSLHNLYHQEVLVRTFTALTEDPPEYIDYVLGYNSNNEKVRDHLKHCFERIDALIEYKRGRRTEPVYWEDRQEIDIKKLFDTNQKFVVNEVKQMAPKIQKEKEVPSKEGEIKMNLRTESWREELKKYNIEYLEGGFPSKQPPNARYATRCCAIKTDLPRAKPKDFYLSDEVQIFIKFCINNDFRYAILSDKYGVHFDDEEKDIYDIHPSSLKEDDFKKLGQIIKQRCTEKGIDTIYYYNTSRLMSIPYFKMLYYSGLKIYYLTSAKLADDMKDNEIDLDKLFG